jgi:hypothetical protein
MPVEGFTNLQLASRSRKRITLDDPVKSLEAPLFVIPAKAGIEGFQILMNPLDSDLNRGDDFLGGHHPSFFSCLLK